MIVNSFAPCGLICGLCKDIHGDCKGCKYGGGEQDCYQLNCCRNKGIPGCWECENFPCDKGYFADKEWKGVIIGFAKLVKEEGPEKVFALVNKKLGNSINYKDYLSISEQNIINMLNGK